LGKSGAAFHAPALANVSPGGGVKNGANKSLVGVELVKDSAGHGKNLFLGCRKAGVGGLAEAFPEGLQEAGTVREMTVDGARAHPCGLSNGLMRKGSARTLTKLVHSDLEDLLPGGCCLSVS